MFKLKTDELLCLKSFKLRNQQMFTLSTDSKDFSNLQTDKPSSRETVELTKFKPTYLQITKLICTATYKLNNY